MTNNTDKTLHTGEGDNGSITISSSLGSGGGIAVQGYQTITLTATYSGSDPTVNAIYWGYANWNFSLDSPATDAPLFTCAFDPPRSEIDPDSGQATTQMTILGLTDIVANISPDAPLEDVLVNAHVEQIAAKVPDGSQYYKVTANSDFPDEKRLLLIDTLAGDPLATGDTYWPFMASYVTYEAIPPAVGDHGWDGTITWSAELVAPFPSGATVKLLNPNPTPVAIGTPMGFALNGIQVTSSGPVFVKVTATATGTSYTNSMTVLAQENGYASTYPNNITITSLDGPNLSMGEQHNFKAQFSFALPTYEWIEWYFYPTDRWVASWSNWTSTDSNDPSVSIFPLQVTDADPIPTAIVAAIYRRAVVSPADASLCFGMTTVSFGASQTCSIDVKLGDSKTSIPLGTPTPVTATVNGEDCGVSRIYWSAEPIPGYVITFNPDFNDLSGSTSASTNITVTGPNTPPLPSVTIYARPDNTVPIGSNTFPLSAGSVSTNTLVIVSLDGNPLKANEPHLLQATYLDANGKPLQKKSIAWSIDPPVTGVTIATPTTTLSDGTSVTTITYTGTGTPSAIVNASSGSDNAEPLNLNFAQDVSLPGAGTMDLSSQPDGDLTYQLTCTYKDGSGKLVPPNTKVTWHGSPSDRLIFSKGSGAQTGDPSNISYTIGNTGVATIEVTVSSGAAIDNAVVGTTGLFNTTTGMLDHSDPDLTLSFEAAATVKGIVIDKAYAQLPPASNPPRKRFPFALI
uniref:hypothetical protein n=1 Tax=Brucella sp. SA075A TaxID=3121521 RepID=UPI003B987FF3